MNKTGYLVIIKGDILGRFDIPLTSCYYNFLFIFVQGVFIDLQVMQIALALLHRLPCENYDSRTREFML